MLNCVECFLLAPPPPHWGIFGSHECGLSSEHLGYYLKNNDYQRVKNSAHFILVIVTVIIIKDAALSVAFRCLCSTAESI
jgi:hypothetical protein